MITPSFGLTATERVLPKLALDFTTASLDPRVTFTRTGNTATVVNSSGNVVGINADLPRFDYDPITLVCKGLLIEEARTNLATYSAAFDDASWGKVACTISATNNPSPDGGNNADTITEDSAASAHFVVKSASSSGVVTASVFAKATTGNRYLVIGFSRAASVWVAATFDLVNGVHTQTLISSYTSPVVSITPFPNGVYRCSITATTDTVNDIRIGLSNASTYSAVTRGFGSYTGDGESGVIVYGAQLEAGAFATSYIPTEATTVTRNADVATMTGTNFSDWFNASEGAFYGEAVVGRQVSAAGTGVYVASNAVTNSMSMFYRGSGATGAQVVDGGATQADLSPTGVLTANQVFKSVLAYKVNNFAASGNAGTVVTDAAGTVPTLDRLLIGTNVNYLNGHVRKISYYPQRLINAEVQAFSK
jgi:hypothetical protein